MPMRRLEPLSDMLSSPLSFAELAVMLSANNIIISNCVFNLINIIAKFKPSLWLRNGHLEQVRFPVQTTIYILFICFVSSWFVFK